VLVRDALIPWLPGQQLMLGATDRRRQGAAFAFKLDYVLHPTPPDTN
jgi:hypothetical protein